jgi:hypothetical protein
VGIAAGSSAMGGLEGRVLAKSVCVQNSPEAVLVPAPHPPPSQPPSKSDDDNTFLYVMLATATAALVLVLAVVIISNITFGDKMVNGSDNTIYKKVQAVENMPLLKLPMA